MHGEAIDAAVHICHALGLLHQRLVGNNHHIGGGEAVNILIFNRFECSYFVESGIWIEHHKLAPIFCSTGSERLHSGGVVGLIVGIFVFHGLRRIVDIPHHSAIGESF